MKLLHLSFYAQACKRAKLCTLESLIMHCEIVVCRFLGHATAHLLQNRCFKIDVQRKRIQSKLQTPTHINLQTVALHTR